MIKKAINRLMEDGKVFVNTELAEAIEKKMEERQVKIFIFPMGSKTMIELDIPEEK